MTFFLVLIFFIFSYLFLFWVFVHFKKFLVCNIEYYHFLPLSWIKVKECKLILLQSKMELEMNEEAIFYFLSSYFFLHFFSFFLFIHLFIFYLFIYFFVFHCLAKDGWNHEVFKMELNCFIHLFSLIHLFFAGHCIEIVSNIMESQNFMLSKAKLIFLCICTHA